MRRAVLVGLITIIGAVAPRSGAGQSSGATPPANAAAPAAAPHARRVAISKAVFGDAAIIVNARDDGFIEIAAAGPRKTYLLQLRTLAARAWVDSTRRILRARPRRSATPRTYRSDIEEYGTSGTMALSRKVVNGESTYTLFFSDDPLAGFTVPIEASEADVFVAIVNKAAAQSAKMLEKGDTAASRGDSTARDSAKRTPATKKPAAAQRPSAAKKPPAAKPAASPPVKP